ncbi:MAG: phosphoribosylglycinamide formyltransferase [Acidobacteria bacterium]|nr:phosphoribosylglycinamide formyltransferase [Acidobacteriota bacterium]
MKARLGILLSGRGSNFLAIHRATVRGELAAEISCVIANRADAPGLLKAREMGLPAYFVRTRGDREAYETEMAALLEQHRVQLVCLAGFMKILGPVLLRQFAGRILNIHPALLPAFPGLHAQEQAWRYGVKYAGCTVHFVDAGVDTGPVVAQAVVPVLDDDTPTALADRILEQEHRLYAEAIKFVIENQYVIDGRRVMKKK